MIRITSLMCFIALCSPSGFLQAAKPNTLSKMEQQGGWKLLFDGKTTNGWRNYKKDGISDGWKVQDGSLVRAAKGAGDIITANQYDSFELSLEFMVSKGGNSGIMFHVTETEPAPWQTGPEIQINDYKNGHDPQRAGWLYQLYKPGNDPATGEILDAFRGHDQWNQVHLRVTPQQCEINLNGVRYARFQKGSEDWNRRVAASKFRKYKNFGKPTKGHICLQDHGDLVAFRNIKIRELPESGEVPDPIDGTLALKPVPAFPNIEWAGWKPVNEQGKNIPLRPIVLTHAGDGSHRIFVATQRGVIHMIEGGKQATKTKIFADLTDRVIYSDRQNEEGFLGLAFHPNYKENGEFYVYYTAKNDPHTSIISRFKVSPGDRDKADLDSEEVLLRIKQPFWNHNGGTIDFGPDGYLYIGLGDGGSANDPYGNAQNLSTLLGSILRIDVDRKSDGKNYAIPSDNPFVGRQDACPEIYAYGLRNVWQLAFDRETGDLWVGEVGQNLWEEINIIEKGGNYGWNLREASHIFGAHGADARKDLIDPIWEYDHQVGKSITGGYVYRGRQLPELQGKYVYADYVTGKIWALDYDRESRTVRSNMAIPSEKMPVISFGEDEQGELYFMIVSPNGQGIFRFQRPFQNTLQNRMKGKYRRRPLVDVIKDIAQATKLSIKIDGNALKDSGFTKNMPIKITRENPKAQEVMRKIVSGLSSPVPEKALCFCLPDKGADLLLSTKKFARANGYPILHLK